MMDNILMYLACGVIFGFLVEALSTYIDIKYNSMERIAMWLLWPPLAVIMLYHFFKELLNRD